MAVDSGDTAPTERRGDTVTQVLNLWRRHNTQESQIRIVGIVGHAGIGKSWIAKELYRELRNELSSVWPENFVINSAAQLSPISELKSRRIAFPQLDGIGLKAVMRSFAWIGFSCEGVERYQVGTQTQLHVDSYESLYERLSKRQLLRSRALLWLTGIVGMGSIVQWLFPSIASVGLVASLCALVGLLSVSKDFRELVITRGRGSQRRGRVELVHQSERLSYLLKIWTRLHARDVPVVLFVDDAHDADEELVGLIDNALQGLPQIFVVFTARSVGHGMSEVKLSGMRQLVLRRSESYHEIRLSPLSREESREIVKNHFPDAHPEISEEVVRHSGGNPLVLLSNLAAPSLEAILRRKNANADVISEAVEVLQEMPTMADEVLRAYWLQLPKPLRELTAWAALQGVLLLENALAATSTLQSGEVAQQIAHLGGDYHWFSTASRDGVVWRFVDAQLWRVAEKPPASAISPVARREAEARLLEYARKTLLARPPVSARMSFESRILLAVVAEHVRKADSAVMEQDLGHALSFCESSSTDGHSGYRVKVLEAVASQARKMTLSAIYRRALLLLLQTAVAREDIQSAVPWADQLKELVTSATVNVATPLELIAAEIITLEEFESLIGLAIAQRDFDLAVSYCNQALEQSKPETLSVVSHRIKFLAARAEAGRGQVARALQTVQKLIATNTSSRTVGGVATEVLLGWRVMELYWSLLLTSSSNDLDRLRGLVAEIETEWKLSQAVFAWNQFHLYLLWVRARQNLQAFSLQVGNVDESLDMGYALLSEVEATLGRRHFECLTVRGGIAHSLAAAGRHDETLQLLDELIDDREAIYGKFHNLTFNSRRSRCETLSRVGDFRRALSEALLLEADMYEGFQDESHPDLLRHQVRVIKYFLENDSQSDAITRANQLVTRVRHYMSELDPVRVEFEQLLQRLNSV